VNSSIELSTQISTLTKQQLDYETTQVDVKNQIFLLKNSLPDAKKKDAGKIRTKISDLESEEEVVQEMHTSTTKSIEKYNKKLAIVDNNISSMQKAMLVEIVKIELGGVALAIGDGANDVSMIQISNVGIGIMGKEGTQAALAADFVIHRFRHLVRLLFVHGRYSFLRTANVALLSLYKNISFNLVLCYFAFYSLYTAQPCFDSYMMSTFSVFFTALFPMSVGAFEQDISQACCMTHPKAYFYFKVDTIFDF
jgi:magnesium-transporting ATPase (P-type)